MKLSTLKLLTWTTVAMAVASALLLATLAPELNERAAALDARSANAMMRRGAVPAASGTPEQPGTSPH